MATSRNSPRANTVEYKCRAVYGILDRGCYPHPQGTAFMGHDDISEIRHDAAALSVQVEEHELVHV